MWPLEQSPSRFEAPELDGVDGVDGVDGQRWSRAFRAERGTHVGQVEKNGSLENKMIVNFNLKRSI